MWDILTLYSLFSSGFKLNSIECLKENGRLLISKGKGYFVDFFENGKIFSQGNFKNGIKNGKWKYYHRNGILSCVVTYFSNSNQSFLTPLDTIINSYDSNGIVINKKNNYCW